jgi:hypothetical protein
LHQITLPNPPKALPLLALPLPALRGPKRERSRF